ncbi:unnamed protein product [Prunus armeniaca]
MEQDIEDDVDVISVSLSFALEPYDDPIAKASLSAMAEGVYTIINQAYPASKQLAPKADTPSPMPKEDTLPRCQIHVEAPDCRSSQIAKTTLHDTCHHRNDLHKVPHRKSTPTSHFHSPINTEQYP